MVSIKNNLSCNQARREKLPLTKVLLQAGLDVETIGCSSLSAAVPADEYQFTFLLLTCTLVFQSASVPGLDQQ